MRELFDLSEKYGFKAPLVDAPESLDLKLYLRLCGALSISPITIAVISDVFIALQDIEERIASFQYISERINRKISGARNPAQGVVGRRSGQSRRCGRALARYIETAQNQHLGSQSDAN